ncbi:hypothetical protein BKA56DRAFT_590870 [Ilyonectria sp. MPI-CAGE-AT-0026]|nr:hypothetical protein BKA56DRAFT_590870 [Ilyonectria sp. MPI-CAGE-AT-0026]
MGPGRVVSMRPTRLRESVGERWLILENGVLDWTGPPKCRTLLLLISEPARFLAVRDPL